MIKGESAADVAAALGVTEKRYHSWEAGEEEPEIDEFCLLAQHFIITTDALLNDTFDYKEYLRIIRLNSLIPW